MEYYNNKVFITVALLFVGIIGDKIESESRTNHPLMLQNVEVPDSSLMLLDRMTVKTSPVAQFRAKQTQVQVTNTSTSSSSSSEAEESDSESRLCTCSLGVCKCCTGLIMNLFNQKACMKVAYHPGDFAFDVAMSWNERILYESSMSGKNPNPICIHPPRMNNLKVCAKFYNVFFPGRNFHFCLAMSGQWRSLELFNVAFDCLRMGANGIVMVKPEDAGGLIVPNPQGGVNAVVDSGDDIEDYDENVVKSLLDIFDR